MIHRIALPKFDANITEATVGRWLKTEGDLVKKDDLLVEMITDKATFELTSEAQGVLRKIVAPEKSQVPLGYVVALVGGPRDPLPDVSAENRRLMDDYLASVTAKTVSAPEKGPGPSSPAEPAEPIARVRATPKARRLARRHNIDLALVQKALGVEVVTEEHVQEFRTRKPDLE
jgi:pyruvate/2-oxoglutarate dehydrogenase complex dihydrolipoamide acyltransferase (E2) component